MNFNAAFWKWFGKSKVVDSKGNPLVVYHASPNEFNIFDPSKCDLGCHFGTKRQAEYVGSSAGKPMVVSRFYLKISKPYRMIDTESWEVDRLVLAGQLPSDIASDMTLGQFRFKDRYALRKALERGYDGVVYLNRYEGLGRFSPADAESMTDMEFKTAHRDAKDSYIVWHPEQIKSIGNDGTWDADDADIRSNPPRLGQRASGTFYRVGAWSAPRNISAQDLIDYAADEEGNEDIREQANSVLSKKDLKRHSADDLIWVTKTKKAALRYGSRDEIDNIDLDGIVLAKDGDDGFLILMD